MICQFRFLKPQRFFFWFPQATRTFPERQLQNFAKVFHRENQFPY